MYSIQAYGRMIADCVRTDAYAEAMRRAIRPGSIVLEIGTGIGLFAVLAQHLGARRVIAVEPDVSIQVAREVAAANSCDSTIEYIQDRSDRITLDTRADVIVSDLRGVLPLLTSHIPSIIDARKRHLAPNGTLIPQCDTIWGAVVEAPELYEEIVGVWEQSHHGVRLSAGRRLAVNSMRKAKVDPEQFLGEAVRMTDIDYRTIESPNLEMVSSWTALRSGTAHGFCLWFDTELFDGIGFSNAPGKPEAIYGKMFFPLAEPVLLDVGDRITCQFQASLVGDDYVWRWDTEVCRRTGDTPSANLSQSTFHGAPMSIAQLRKRAADYRPVANDDGAIDSAILNMMTGELTSEQIAHHLLASYPDRFQYPNEALTRIGTLAQKYSSKDQDAEYR